MAEQFLDRSYVGSTPKQLRGERMPERVTPGGLPERRTPDCVPNGFLHRADVQMVLDEDAMLIPAEPGRGE